jgi:hypothetical protein
MPFEVTPSRPGAFEADIKVFLDNGRLVVQQVAVGGLAVGEAAKWAH